MSRIEDETNRQNVIVEPIGSDATDNAMKLKRVTTNRNNHFKSKGKWKKKVELASKKQKWQIYSEKLKYFWRMQNPIKTRNFWNELAECESTECFLTVRIFNSKTSNLIEFIQIDRAIRKTRKLWKKKSVSNENFTKSIVSSLLIPINFRLIKSI